MGMILRIVRGRVADTDLEALRSALTGPFAAAAGAAPGLRRYHAATRPDADGTHELVVLTRWATVDDALRAYDGDLDAVRTLADLSGCAALDAVAYFELDEVHDLGADARPAFLRLTVGRVARGADADIQRELRSRVTELDALALEACVARRILGGEVEIAFVSTWEREDPSLPLAASFWPDISAQYDTFEVGVYRLIVSGPAGA
jgi:hypothetical protein